MIRILVLAIVFALAGCIEDAPSPPATPTPQNDMGNGDEDVRVEEDQGDDAGGESCNPACSEDTPICDDGTCVECITPEDCEEGVCLDGTCVECTGDGDCDGVCVENQCVACRDQTDCPDGVCTDAGACVACVESTDCDDTTPICLGEGEDALCVACTEQEDSICTANQQVCDPESNECVNCVSDADCTDVERAQCDLASNTCTGCTESAACEGIGDTDICNLDIATCVECLPSTEVIDCGATACDPQTFECTSVDRNTLQICEPCSSSSECSGDLACVQTSFMGSDAGSYCLAEKQMGTACSTNPPFSSSLSGAMTVEGTTATFCGLNNNLTTCAAYNDFAAPKGCMDDIECGVPGLQDGVCYEMACNYTCGIGFDCPTGIACNQDDVCSNP